MAAEPAPLCSVQAQKTRNKRVIHCTERFSTDRTRLIPVLSGLVFDVSLHFKKEPYL